jgi:hypothetical protein
MYIQLIHHKKKFMKKFNPQPSFDIYAQIF